MGWDGLRPGLQTQRPRIIVGIENSAVPSTLALDMGEAFTGSFTITNNSDLPGSASVSVLEGPYTIVSGASSGVLAPEASVTVTVRTGTIGSQSGTLRVTSTQGVYDIEVTSALSYFPSSLAGYLADYDASDLVLADAAAVTAWPDKAGTHNLSSPTGTITYDEDGLLGSPAVAFGTGNHYFSLPAGLRTVLNSAGAAEVVMVMTMPAATQFLPASIGVSGGVPANPAYRTSAGIGLYWNGSGTATLNTAGVTVPHIVSASGQTGQASTLRLYFDGTPLSQNNNVTGFAVPTAITLGNRTGQTYTGRLAHALFFSQRLSTGDREALVDWLAQKWLITANTP